ncbi:O-methyltransferase [Kribbella solani]|uniref:Putative O-methyltransferase YrrM n=1 Tax=Kribbella solani TaxID=236067 RepID=A0A841E5C6_9ACTN|nr:O-methyltransferase [Kribbella solani]MBB5983567.1 putative O-methyltransferase YrrM [Kribbella solani]MDX2971558.1 O-methyltransferase [Kribbella solani]
MSSAAADHPSEYWEGTIATGIDPTSWAYAEDYTGADEAVTGARASAAESGIAPIGAGAASALSLLAACAGAKAVVEIGTGTGVSGLALLRGMRADGTLTTVDIDAENQRLARKTFLDAGITSNRFRLIAGSGLDVVTRLTDGHYDLVFCDADRRENTAYLHEALRLLRPGGLVVFAGVLANGRLADPARRDADTMALRDLIRAVREDDDLVSALLPTSDGLLTAAKRLK